jgi:hypothetical protein
MLSEFHNARNQFRSVCCAVTHETTMRIGPVQNGIYIKAVVILFALLWTALSNASAQAVRVHPLAHPKPELVISGTLSITASPSAVNFTLVHKGVAPGSSGVTINTNFSGLGVATTMDLYAYFASPTSALSDGRTPANLIPSSAVLGQVTTGLPTSYTAFTQATPFNAAACGLQLYDETDVLNLGVSRTDVLNLEINLSGVSIPAGTYTGTLTLQAVIN